MGDPGFSELMIECAADGSHGAFEIRRSRRVQLTANALKIEDLTVPYAQVLDVGVGGNFVALTYVGSDGKRAERYFRCETFWPGGGKKVARRLYELLAPKIPMRAPSSASGAVRAEAKGPTTVLVRANAVAFPSRCPSCLAPGTEPARLRADSGLATGTWLVPVCEQHASTDGVIRVDGWSRRSSEITFTFKRPDYAKEFLELNVTEEPVAPLASKTEAALRRVQAGTRFVEYRFAASAIVVSVNNPSDIIAVGPEQTKFVRGIPYSLLSLVAGPWGFPHGPVFTVAAIIANCRGGLDLTPAFSAVVQGQRFVAVT